MEIHFSQHAKEQLKRRKISPKKVLETINKGKKQSSFRQRKIYQNKFGKKNLEVIAVQEISKLIIITAYYL